MSNHKGLWNHQSVNHDTTSFFVDRPKHAEEHWRSQWHTEQTVLLATNLIMGQRFPTAGKRYREGCDASLRR